MSIELFDIELLKKFTAAAHPDYKDVLATWSYRGDGTQTGDDRARQEMGAERFAHRDWNTMATNGRILVRIPNQKHPGAVEVQRGAGSIPALIYWCISAARKGEEGTRPAKEKEIARVPDDVRALASLLPKLEWVEVQYVTVNCHGNRGVRKKREKAPDHLLFFRFEGGSGMAIMLEGVVS